MFATLDLKFAHLDGFHVSGLVSAIRIVSATTRDDVSQSKATWFASFRPPFYCSYFCLSGAQNPLTEHLGAYRIYNRGVAHRGYIYNRCVAHRVYN
jgi:hypothetical protein